MQIQKLLAHSTIMVMLTEPLSAANARRCDKSRCFSVPEIDRPSPHLCVVAAELPVIAGRVLTDSSSQQDHQELLN